MSKVPAAAKYWSFSIALQDSQKGFLWNFNRAELFHPALAGLLLFKKFALPGDIPAVEFGRDILTQRLDRAPRDDLCTDCRLNCDLELLSRE